MQNDPDLNIRQNQVFGSGMGPVFTNVPPGRAGAGSAVMGVFSLANLAFLIVAASYSLGIMENVETASDGASFFALVVMVLIAGGLGAFCSYIGLRLARVSQINYLVLAHKAILGLLALAIAAVLIGPVFN